MGNKKAVLKNRNKSSKAAILLYEVIKAYQPAWYDFMGYDVSGKRQRLIEAFVDDPKHTKAVDKAYGKELDSLCKYRAGKLIQELRFGMLVNKIFEDMGLALNSKKLRSEISPIVLKIAKDSKGEYAHYRDESKDHHHAARA